MRNKNLAVIASVAVLAAFAPHARPAPARWALIVGISDYVNFGSEIGGDLPGARPDAMAFRDVLVARYGFTDSNIHLVLDREATRDRIITELKTWLPSVAKPGDLVVFYYAGHGSQVWDTNGDEEDGLDETICPTDVLKGNPNKDIPDDELNALLNAIPSDHVVVTLDNCHAGSGTRAVTPFARPRSLSRVASADLPKPGTATSGKPVNSSAAASERLANKILEISSAGADEVAVDAEWPGEGGAPARVGGAFTTNFVRNLWQAPRGASYQDVFQMTVEDMKRDRFAQRPGISRADRQAAFVPFGETANATANEAAVPVLSATAAGVQLGGGAAAGMTVGSVYTSGATSLRVTAVEATRATATAAGGSVKAGDRAKLTAYRFPTPELRVSVSDLAPANRTAVGAALSKIAGVRVVDTRQQFAHLLIRPAERAGYNIIGMDGAIRHSVTTTDPAAIAAIITRESGAHQLAELENPARPFSLEFGFAGDKSAFRVGDEIQFHAVSSRDGYLTIIDLGTDGKIGVLYPTDQKDNRVKAGQRITLPPPAAGIRFEAQNPVGRGIVRAFLTERPLALPSTELDAAQAGQVVDALRNAVGGTSAAAALPVTNWATTSVVYTVTR